MIKYTSAREGKLTVEEAEYCWNGKHPTLKNQKYIAKAFCIYFPPIWKRGWPEKSIHISPIEFSTHF